MRSLEDTGGGEHPSALLPPGGQPQVAALPSGALPGAQHATFTPSASHQGTHCPAGGALVHVWTTPTGGREIAATGGRGEGRGATGVAIESPRPRRTMI